MTDSVWLQTHWFALVLAAWAVAATLAALILYGKWQDAEWVADNRQKHITDLINDFARAETERNGGCWVFGGQAMTISCGVTAEGNGDEAVN